jgi:hypothetical protein
MPKINSNTLTNPTEQNLLEKFTITQLVRKFLTLQQTQTSICCCGYKILPLYPAHALTPYLMKIHFNIALPILWCSKWPTAQLFLAHCSY